VANTIKGKGVSFMENKPKWHSNWLAGELEKQAMEELS
jgi:transketolase